MWTRLHAEPLNPVFDLGVSGVPINIKVGNRGSIINWISLSGYERIQGVSPGGFLLDGEPITVSFGRELSRESEPFMRTEPWLALTFAGTVPDPRFGGVADHCARIKV
jgi:hypothetical protein